MKRIMIIGCCGAGKSTMARDLSKIIDLPVIHLDQHYWKPNWVESGKAIWKETVVGLARREEWIIDGNYGGTLDIRIDRADTIVYLDYPTITCLWRITKRIFKYRGKTRPDMPEGCHERFDLQFYHYVLTYNLRRRSKTMQKLDQLRGEKKVLIFRNDSEVADFLLGIGGGV